MTRKEIKQWAEETVRRIFHGHDHSQTFPAEIRCDLERTIAVITYQENGHMMYLTSYLPPLDHTFKTGDIVDVTITKRV